MVENINRTSKNVTDKLKISDIVGKTFPEKDCYIAIKDDNTDYEENPPTRIINPSRSEIGKMSKKF